MSPKFSSVLRGTLTTLMAVLYPVGIWYGLTHWDTRTVSLGIAVATLLILVTKLRGVGRSDLSAILRIPLTVIVLALAGALLNDPRFIFAMPILVSLTLFGHFAASLRTTPIIERVARSMRKGEALNPAEQAYTRSVTKIWCGFFIANALTAGALAIFSTLEIWTLWTGLLSYIAMGLLFTVEVIVRKIRFRRYSHHPHDRILAHFFPPPAPAPAEPES